MYHMCEIKDICLHNILMVLYIRKRIGYNINISLAEIKKYVDFSFRMKFQYIKKIVIV